MSARIHMSSVLRWSWRSLAAVSVAAIAAGLLEGAVHQDRVGLIAAGAGFAALAAVPIGLLLSLVTRLMWRGWAPRERVARVTDEHGNAPALMAWVITAWLGVGVIWHALFYGYMLSANLKRGSVHALVVAMIAVAAAAVVAFASVPLTRVLTSALARLAGSRRWRGWRPCSPRSAVALALVIAAVVAVLLWFKAIRPRIGAFDLGELIYLAAFAPTLILAHLLLDSARASRLARPLSAAAVLGLAALVGSAVFVRVSRPLTMLDIWGDLPSGSVVIGGLYDFEEARDLFAPQLRPTPLPGTEHGDIVLITVDTLRADVLGLYGGPTKTPNLRRLAERGAFFRWAFSPSNNTRRSMSSMAIGLSPRRVRGRVAGWALRLDPRHVLLAERLRAGGYQTVGFFCCSSHFGAEHRLGLIRGVEKVVIEKGDDGLLGKTLEWLRERDASDGDDRPLFLWIHLIDPHLWHEGVSRGKERREGKAIYGKSLTKVDRLMAPLLRHLRKREDTTIIVTSDHGEGLGDHGVPFHSSSLYNSEIRVPLIAAGPGIDGGEIDAPVSLIDLVPTIMELAGFEPPGGLDGTSLVPLLRGEKDRGGEARPPVVSYQITDRSVEVSKRSIIAHDHKLIVGEPGGPRLYDLRGDPHEKKNLYKSEPELAARLRALLDERVRRDEQSPFD